MVDTAIELCVAAKTPVADGVVTLALVHPDGGACPTGRPVRTSTSYCRTA